MKTKPVILLIVTSSFLATASSLTAQVVTFTIKGLSGTTPSINGTDFNGTNSDFSATPVLTRTGLDAEFDKDAFASSDNLVTQNTPDFSQKYIGFALSPGSGNVLFAKSLTFSTSGSQKAGNQYGVAYSTDGFSTSVSTTGFVTTSSEAKSYDFTDLITNDTLAFRIQNFGTMAVNGSPAAPNGSFQLTSNSLTVTGSVVESIGAIGLTAATEIRNSSSLSLSGVISGSFGITKTGVGTLTFGSVNNYTGSTIISNGTLAVTGSIGTSDVSVNGGIIASGSTGTVGKNVTVNSGGTLAAGGLGVVGVATVATDLNFSSGSIFDWDLNTGAGTYDKVNVSGALNITSGAKFNVVSSTAFSDPFWSTTQTWSDIFGTKAINNFNASNFLYSGSATAPTQGSFSITGSTLTWTAVPEPTSALAGLLIAAGLLRRRRMA